jgi:long-chain fatty acid transport protein
MIFRLGILSTSVCLFALSSNAFSSGFAIIEHSASGMGASFAGAAAVGEDASTIWFNPAAMSLLGDKTHVSGSGHIIIPTAKFSDRGSSVNPGLGGTLSGKNDNGGKTAFVPNLYYVKPINDKMHIGVGINAPFGLEVNYDKDWYGRYHATKSEMKTININPSVSWELNDRVSLGAGLSAQYIDVTLGSAIDSAAACRSIARAANSGTLLNQCLNLYPQVGQAANDSQAKISGDDWSYGFNLGVLFQPTDKTRLGVSYRSKVKHSLSGDADFTLDQGLQAIVAATGIPNFNDRAVTAGVDLPESVSLSVAHKINDKLELLGDVSWMGWSSFDKLTVIDTTGTEVANTPELWNDVYRVSVGGKYKYNDKLTLRAGAAYDESPIPGPKLRTPRVPGNDRTWVSFGAGYKLSKNLNLDLGYAHLFIDDTPIDNTDDNGYSVRGIYEADVDILSAQLNWTF